MGKGKLYHRPKGEMGPFYSPQDSIIAVFPAAIQVATIAVLDPQYTEFQEMLYKHGATPEGLKNAAQCYKNYFEILVNHTAHEEAHPTFVDAGFPLTDISFLLFNGVIAGTLAATYHESLVDLKSEQMEYRESFMRDAIKCITNKLEPPVSDEPVAA